MNAELFADWQKDIDSWNKNQFIHEVGTYLYERFGTNQDKHAVGMLAESIETFILCTKDIRLNGMVITHKNGVLGKNHHIDIRDKSLNRSLALMADLGLLPKSRKPMDTKKDPKLEAFLMGPKGYLALGSCGAAPIPLKEIELGFRSSLDCPK